MEVMYLSLIFFRNDSDTTFCFNTSNRDLYVLLINQHVTLSICLQVHLMVANTREEQPVSCSSFINSQGLK